MSNRLRIFFHCAQEGQAHIGKHALLAMERLLMQCPPTANWEWITDKEWASRGKPAFSDKMMVDFEHDDVLGDVGHMYKVPSALALAPPAFATPKFPAALERAKWLWKNLPQEMRKHCQLVVTRESRTAHWKNSRANPAVYGLSLNGKPKARKTAHSKLYTTPVTTALNTNFLAGTLWNTAPLAATALATAAAAAVGAAGAPAPAPAKKKPLLSDKQDMTLPKSPYKPSSYEKMLAKEKAITNWSTGGKKKLKEAVGDPEYIKYAHDDVYEDEPDGKPNKSAKTGKVGTAEEASKPRLGIWS